MHVRNFPLGYIRTAVYLLQKLCRNFLRSKMTFFVKLAIGYTSLKAIARLETSDQRPSNNQWNL